MPTLNIPVYLLCISPAAPAQHPRRRNSRFRHLHFSSGSFPYSIRLFFPFRRPMKLAAAILGGIPISI